MQNKKGKECESDECKTCGLLRSTCMAIDKSCLKGEAHQFEADYTEGCSSNCHKKNPSGSCGYCSSGRCTLCKVEPKKAAEGCECKGRYAECEKCGIGFDRECGCIPAGIVGTVPKYCPKHLTENIRVEPQGWRERFLKDYQPPQDWIHNEEYMRDVLAFIEQVVGEQAKEHAKFIRKSQIERPKDALEEAWNAELERIAIKIKYNEKM